MHSGPVIAPVIDGHPVALGDVVSGPVCGIFSNGRVKGWSPCGKWLCVAWLGVVPVDQAAWCTDIESTHFARLYKPVKENRWECKACGWGIPN